MIQQFFQRWVRRVTDLGNVAMFVLASFAAAWAGPFGSYYGFSFGGSLLFWGAIIGTSLVLASIIMTFREVAFDDHNPVLGELVSCMAFTVLFGPAVWVFTETVHAQYGGAPLTLWQCTLASLIVAVGIVIMRLALMPRAMGQAAGVAADAEASAETPRLLKRLPEGIEGPILRLNAQDHFVEIVTAQGKHQVRMRLADAVAEMDGVEGFYTHRSHWVARTAIKELKRSGTRHYVVSADAELIPVSRSNLPKLSEEGLAP